MDKSSHEILTAILAIAISVPLILRLRKLKNKDLEVWCVRGIVAIFALILFAAASDWILFLRFFKSVPMGAVLIMTVCCIIDFEPPRRCKPERKVTNVSAILPSDLASQKPSEALSKVPQDQSSSRPSSRTEPD